MKKKRLVVFALTASILLSGCTLSKESNYEKASTEPVIVSQQITDTVEEFQILKSELIAPSTEEAKEEILEYVSALEGENQVVVYQAESALTRAMELEHDSVETQRAQDQSYSEEIFLTALQENPMIQIYYCGSEGGKREEEAIARSYPNVTYVEANENVDSQIQKLYQRNQVCGYCIVKFRDGKSRVENFDLGETVDTIQKRFHEIDKQSIIDGLSRFCEYAENTTLFQKGEEVSDKVSEALEPYVEAAIPKVESAWNTTKPYLEQGVQKVEDVYEDIKPELQDTYESAKEKIKSLFGN